VKSAGDVVEVTVRAQRPFGVFVDMDGEPNALIQAVFFAEKPDPKARVPAIREKLRAIVLTRRKDGQYQLSLRKQDFAHFGRQAEWRAG
jgi:predicted RNA-binding protein with RPS1 domain